jgi:hypothetical protein
MKPGGDKIIEFGNNTGLLRLLVGVTRSVPGADLTEFFRIGLAEMLFPNPYLIEDAELATELGKVFAKVFKWARSDQRCR